MDPSGSGWQAPPRRGGDSRPGGLAGFLVRRPRTVAVLTWAVTLAAAASALILADFGGPAWVFIVLGLWLVTAGLPALAGVLLVASFTQGLPIADAIPLGPALVLMALASLALQASACLLASRLLARRAAGGVPR